MAEKNSGKWRRRACVAVLGLIASGCAGGQGTAASLPPAPEIREVRAADPAVPDDGLLRVIATIPDDDAAEDHTDGPSISGTIERGDSTSPIDLGALGQLPPNSTIEMRDGEVGYLDANGGFVALSDPESTPDVADDPLEYLRALPGVVEVQPIDDTSFSITATSTDALESLGLNVVEETFLSLSMDPYEPYQWALENDGSSLSNVGLAQPPVQTPDSDVDGATARSGATGRGVVVAVIDSGVDFGHRDLSHAQWINPGEDCGSNPNGVDDDGNGYVDDCGGWDFGDDDPTPFDGANDEHGTHVAGLIAARSGNGFGVAGIAPDAAIMDLKVSDSGGVISISSIARAVRYATDNGADIVNLSLGTQPGATRSSVSVLGDAVEYAEANGVLLVTAAGNSSVSLDTAPVFPASFGTSNLLTVGASTSSDGRASFSNIGSDIDLFAPGDLILSTVPGDEVVFMSGTSQASPIAAGTAALMLEAGGGQNPAVLIAAMVESADPVAALDGLAANPMRLNSARAIGIEADLPGVGDAVTIRGLGSDDDGLVTASITIGELGGQFNQPFHWEASLVTLVDGAPFAVTDHPVTVIDDDQVVSSQTDGRGSVLLASDAAQAAQWSTELPPGNYALLIEAVPRTDATARLGDGFLARFDVGNIAAEPGDEASGGSEQPSPGDGGSLDSGEGAGPDDGNSGQTGSGDSGSGGAGSGVVPVSGGPAASDEIDSDAGAGGDPSSPGGDSSGSSDGSSNGENDQTNDGQAGGDTPDATPGDDPANQNGANQDGANQNSGSSGGSDGGAAAGQGDTPGDGRASSEDGSPADDPIDNVVLGPEAGENDGWAITNIAPRTGSVNAKNLVIIDGTFPESVVVWFGETPGELIFGSTNTLMVETPLRATPGAVDVILRTRAGEVLRLPQAYSFEATSNQTPGDEQSGGSSDQSGGSNSSGGAQDEGGSAGSDPTPGDGGAPEDPGSDTPVDDGPADEVGAGNPPADPDDSGDSDRSRNRQARADVIGEPRDLPNGLTGAPLSGLETIGGVPACNEALCRTRRV